MEKAYTDWVLSQYEKRADRRSTSIGEGILRERFAGKGSKRKRVAFKKSPEYRQELERRRQEDEVFTYFHGRTEILKTDEAYYEANREWIERMAAEGLRDFSEYAVRDYRIKTENEQLLKEALSKLGYTDITALVKSQYPEMGAMMRRTIETYLSSEKISITFADKGGRGGHKEDLLSIKNYGDYINRLPDKSGWASFYCDLVISQGYYYPEQPFCEYVLGRLREAMPKGVSRQRKKDICDHIYDEALDAAYRCLCEYSEEAMPILDRAEAVKLISGNPNHKGIDKQYERMKKKELALKAAVLDHIPDNMIDLYPAARQISRKFVLHIGPTNSGKTYKAMQELIKAGSGIYLGPLRLLAYEQYEKFKDRGLSCNLITGEEEILSEDAPFQASTIDVLDFKKGYSCAVIDEAQMLTDEFRGGRWTAAVMGIVADTIHVCAAPEAEEILKKMIKACGDEYEVEYHKRLSALECDVDYCEFPDTVQKGDALIVFSRRSVHAIAAALQKQGYKCSVIYGALPYDVRHEEARKFMEKETDVLVATDAIGMGLNLPIRRVVLMEISKFDGRERRSLLPAEIRQIVGRAGRAGVFDKGYYTIEINTNMMLDQLKHKVENRLPAIKKARIAFPESLLGIDGKVSELIMQWDKIPVSAPFEKASSQREIKLAEMLEEYTSDKQTIYELITIPYDESKPELLERWLGFAIEHIKGREAHFNIGWGMDPIVEAEGLRDAERMYEALDLEYQLCKKYGDAQSSGTIMMQKNLISEEINRFLATQALREKECVICGRPLPWDFSGSKCIRCRGGRRRRH